MRMSLQTITIKFRTVSKCTQSKLAIIIDKTGPWTISLINTNALAINVFYLQYLTYFCLICMYVMPRVNVLRTFVNFDRIVLAIEMEQFGYLTSPHSLSVLSGFIHCTAVAEYLFFKEPD